MSENMKLWNRVKSTDPKYTKDANNGKYGFTCIDPQWQLQKATELWGPYGLRWGMNDLQFTTHDDGVVHDNGSVKLMMIQANFFYPAEPQGHQVNFPIAACIKLRAGDDTVKKLITSARSKALSLLGFSADVFLGKFEDNHYVQMAKVKHGDQDAFMFKATGRIKTAKTLEDLDAIREKIEEMVGLDTITQEQGVELLQVIDEKRSEFSE